MERSPSRNGLQTKKVSKSGLLKYQLQLVKRITPEGKERFEIFPIEEKLTFEEGIFLFMRALLLLTQNNDGVVLVGLAGPSGAGKTVFSDKVTSLQPGIVTISMDNYNDASRLIDGNFDDPRLTDYDTLLENIEGLRNGRAVDVPIYDFKSSSRVGHKRVEVPESRIIIIEGIYALSERLRPLLDMRVSVTGGVHFDLVKRVLRDINRSGQEPKDIIQQITETVYPMYKAYIEPDLQTAHIKIVNKFNPFSGFQKAAYILKSDVTVTEDQIHAVIGPNFLETFEETNDIYLLPPGEDRETCQSYLRMRNREGKYSLIFEEWVTDGQFIISPRITFEVSVRLLGGLMALGYEMVSILKRISHVFTNNDKSLTVKMDKLEQLHRTYVQVQGRDREAVQEAARKLGMEGHYVPRSYIEQIQLEKLTEVMAVPEELKERLGGGLEDIIAGSLPANQQSSGKSLLRSQTWAHPPWDPQTPKRVLRGNWRSGESQRPLSIKVEEMREASNAVEESPVEPAMFQDTDLNAKVEQQLHTMAERLEELMMKLNDIESRLPDKAQPTAVPGGAGCGEPFLALPTLINGHGGHSSVSGGIPRVGSWSSTSTVTSSGTAPFGGSSSRYSSPGYGSAGGWSQEAAQLAEQIHQLLRGQRHLAAQLDNLGSLVRGSSATSMETSLPRTKRSWWETLRGNMQTGDSGLVAVGVFGVTVVAVSWFIIASRLR